MGGETDLVGGGLPCQSDIGGGGGAATGAGEINPCAVIGVGGEVAVHLKHDFSASGGSHKGKIAAGVVGVGGVDGEGDILTGKHI